jgi:hypothetical protein
LLPVSWAHFRRVRTKGSQPRVRAPETGLSASIPRRSLRERLRDFRFYPLRVPRGGFFCQCAHRKQAQGFSAFILRSAAEYVKQLKNVGKSVLSCTFFSLPSLIFLNFFDGAVKK